MPEEADFETHVADRLAALPGVRAVSLGGSRAQGTHRTDSDWDFAIYYRGRFEPQHLRDVGWPGEVSELGAWGGGVFNGGAWLRIDDRPVDVHYRDLDVVEHVLGEARAGRFEWQPLMFHLAGIPSYLVLAELAINRVLHGELPRPEFPRPLREAAPEVWWQQASLTLAYARANHAPHGRLAETAGAIAQAACQSAHAVLAARGEWVTNEKRLLARAGLREADQLIAGLTPDSLVAAVDRAQAYLEAAVTAAR
ncbi:Nucleotidyltransferase domain-containing protein [Saccharopolyspora kobensis]|uniref:Nucleotidyltransferase domain-containing protein n=1 Tax=Saccharopolyspora kobensis TaxID=146035 RepID=A0A1H5TY13_9PSEU|nr:nucleotidyltransferase domain-containing protein [Saccharopolyspora kobensis]SEF67659.1 Nucleotidyltransferase domain-containing protein [Saccharopolyspora kobensis]SFC40966.1 Nucleotidyltransferase domain-containing protein [Saccharopolyspora kobensis]